MPFIAHLPVERRDKSAFHDILDIRFREEFLGQGQHLEEDDAGVPNRPRRGVALACKQTSQSYHTSLKYRKLILSFFFCRPICQQKVYLMEFPTRMGCILSPDTSQNRPNRRGPVVLLWFAKNKIDLFGATFVSKIKGASSRWLSPVFCNSLVPFIGQ